MDLHSDRRAGAIWTLAVDAVTAEVVAAFEADGVECLLFKGPTIARWLYESESERPYADSDLLVAPSSLQRARSALDRLGFTPTFGPLPHPGMESPPGHPWRRGATTVDLHETLPGALAGRERVWSAVSVDATEIEVGGRSVHALGETARLMGVALHAAHHGPRVGQPLRDLGRALRLDDTRWRAAADLAQTIDATAALGTGLDLLPEGRELLLRLGLEAAPSTAWLLATAGVPVAGGLERLASTPGARARARLLGDELIPSPAFMRWWTPLARRSRRGLVAAYVWRAGHLARRLPGALRAVRRARGAGR